MQDELNQNDPLANNNQQYQEDDLNFLLDSYQRRGYNANEMARLANAQGYDSNMVMFNLNDRIEQARSDAEEERRKALDELREFRIAEKTREARLNTQDEYKNEEFVYEADNQFNKAYSNKLLTSKYIKDLQEGNFVLGDVSKINSYLDENGITTSLQAKDKAEAEIINKGLEMQMPVGQDILNFFGYGAQGLIQDFFGSTSQPSEEDIQETLQGLQSLTEQNNLDLKGAVNMQNRINAALGFQTTFEADSPSDLSFIDADVNKRTGFSEAYENGTNIGGVSEGLFDFIEETTGDPGFVRGTVGEVFL